MQRSSSIRVDEIQIVHGVDDGVESVDISLRGCLVERL
jgi:hypothetical protein